MKHHGNQPNMICIYIYIYIYMEILDVGQVSVNFIPKSFACHFVLLTIALHIHQPPADLLMFQRAP